MVDLGSTDGEVMAEKIIAETEKEIAEEVTAQTHKAEQPDEPETVPAPAPTPKPLNPEELQVNLVAQYARNRIRCRSSGRKFRRRMYRHR